MTTPRARDESGRFIKLECPICREPLQHEPHTRYTDEWICTGLIDPEDVSKELQPCTYSYQNPFPVM